jgi:DnaJ family protein B protein 12
MSEANKEQAEVCARRGLVALQSGDAATAARLLEKALRMHDLGPSIRASLDRAREMMDGQGASAEADTPNPSPFAGAGRAGSSTRMRSDEDDDGAGPTPTWRSSSSGSSSSSATGPASPFDDGVRRRGQGAGATPRPSGAGAPSSSTSSTPRPSASPTSTSGSTPRPAPAPTPTPAVETRPHTPEMVEIVRKVKAAKTYYDLLGVAKDANEDAIARAYKKLALKVHPDKNAAPGSDEAFKRLGAAYAVLTDKDKRAAYDRYGEQGTEQQQARAQHYEEEVSPEDIFNMMFGGGFGPMGGMGTRVHFGPGFGGGRVFFRDAHGNLRPANTGGRGAHPGTRPGRARGAGEDDEDDGAAFGGARGAQLLQILPLLIFFLFSFISFSGSDDRVYSLRPTEPFTVPRTTSSSASVAGLTYYVRPELNARLESEGPRGSYLRKVEEAVQADSYRDFANACATETSREAQLKYNLQYATNPHRREMLQTQLQAHHKPNCEEFEKYFGEKAQQQTQQGRGKRRG